jgi:hypothetical protein
MLIKKLRFFKKFSLRSTHVGAASQKSSLFAQKRRKRHENAGGIIALSEEKSDA